MNDILLISIGTSVLLAAATIAKVHYQNGRIHETSRQLDDSINRLKQIEHELEQENYDFDHVS